MIERPVAQPLEFFVDAVRDRDSAYAARRSFFSMISSDTIGVWA